MQTPIEEALSVPVSKSLPQVALCISLNPSDDKRTKEAIDGIYAIGFTYVDIVPGVKGNNIPENDLKRLLSTRAYNELKNGRYVHEAISSKGAVGCYLAHVQCWSRIADGKDGNEVAIFEDDFTLNKNALNCFKMAYGDAKARGYDILRLAHRRNPDIGEDLAYETDDLARVKRTESAAAYILTVNGARKLLALAFPIEMQLDHFLDMATTKGDIKHYALKNSLHKEVNKGSQINHNGIKLYKDGFNKNTLKRHSLCLVVVILVVMFMLYMLLVKRR